MNALTALRAGLTQVEVSIAVRIDDRDTPRIIARHWCHSGPRVLWMLLGALPLLPIGYGHVLPSAALATVLTLVYVGSRLADRTHEVGWIDQVHPCPLCTSVPGDDDGNGGGGIWLDAGWDDIPPAPAPMDDIDDDRIRAWAAGADQWLIDLTATTRRATEGDAL